MNLKNVSRSMNVFCKAVIFLVMSSSILYGMDGVASNKAGDPCRQERVAPGKDHYIESFVAQALLHKDAQLLSVYIHDYPIANKCAEDIVRKRECEASQLRETLQNAQKMAMERKRREATRSKL